MGELTEMILEGILCEKCGQYIGQPIGYPQKCKDCKDDDDSD
jgi:predicted Zn-ribbon and HTH transcriptional regulator